MLILESDALSWRSSIHPRCQRARSKGRLLGSTQRLTNGAPAVSRPTMRISRGQRSGLSPMDGRVGLFAETVPPGRRALHDPDYPRCGRIHLPIWCLLRAQRQWPVLGRSERRSRRVYLLRREPGANRRDRSHRRSTRQGRSLDRKAQRAPRRQILWLLWRRVDLGRSPEVGCR
jgi:hypothetical protein